MEEPNEFIGSWKTLEYTTSQSVVPDVIIELPDNAPPHPPGVQQ